MASNIILISPEIFMAVMVCLILLVGAWMPLRSQVPFYLALAALFGTGIIVIRFLCTEIGKSQLVFDGTFILDNLALVLKLFILIAVFFTFLYSNTYNAERRIPRTEFYVLGLLSTLGMLFLVSAHNLVMVFLGVELLSLPTYAMVAMQRKEGRCIEAGMKYFIIGALSSGMLLYGFSMIFGVTQQLDLHAIAAQLALGDHNYLAICGLVFALCGLAFKFGAAPFHVWVPDVYEGAPSSVTLFLAAAPKIAGFGMIMRVLVGALPELHVQWQEMLMVIAILSMTIGNFAAIVQTNLKRMLAYSSVANAGYALLGIISATATGYAASMFYVTSYAAMTLVAFGMLILLSRAGLEVEKIEDLKSLHKRYPWLALLILFVMFSLSGVPPLVGFIAKVAVLQALIEANLIWLAVIAVVLAVVGAYYYIRVIKVIYFSRNAQPVLLDVHISTSALVAISINGLAILIIGLFPQGLISLCQMAFNLGAG